MWLFSAYAPGKNAPIQLMGGPEREQSFEEMRAIHYAAAAAGTPQQAIQDANNLYAAVEAQIKNILNDVDGAIKYVVEAENQHPNRLDIVAGKTSAPAPFRQPSTSSSPFSQVGQPQNPAFGQPSQASPFGQPAQAATTPAFGQPSALGQQRPAFGQPAFGQPSMPGQQPALGQPAFGQPAFGQPAAAGQSPFAQIAAQPSTQQNPFGQAAGQASPFAQLGTQTQQPSPFAQSQQQQAQASQPFGQPAQSTQPNPFGQPQAAPTASPFGQLGAATNKQQSGFAAAPTNPNAFGQQQGPQGLQGQQDNPASTQRGQPPQKLTSWKGRPVKYINDEPCYQHPDDPQKFVRIFFPHGPPPPENSKDAVGKPEDYTQEIEEAYRYAKEHGAFKDGFIPRVPPKMEWCSFDF